MEVFRKTKYHVRGGGSILVTSAQQEKALGPDWVDIKPPTQATSPKPAPIQETVPKMPQKKRGRQRSAEVTA